MRPNISMTVAESFVEPHNAGTNDTRRAPAKIDQSRRVDAISCQSVFSCAIRRTGLQHVSKRNPILLSLQTQLLTVLLVSVHQDNRRVPLSLRNLPIGVDQSILLFRGNQPKTVSLVKANRPIGSCPGAD
jgi:hypothetical protein